MRRATISKLTALTAAGLTLTGCAQAEKTHYMNHLGLTLVSAPASRSDVAIAFGLDQQLAPPASVAIVEP